MKILFAGVSGYLGQKLSRALKLSGHEIVALSRRADPIQFTDRTALWDGETLGDWVGELETADGLINLTGRSIACRWTEANKKEIRDSRVGTTELLAEAVRLVSVPPRVWLNASATGIYAANVEEALDESAPPGTGYLAELGYDWEAALFEPDMPDCRRAALRTSVVLGAGSGAFDVFAKLTRWFLGGHQGSGRQWMSWIHVDDWVRMAQWLLETEQSTPNTEEGRPQWLQGAFNLTAPEPVRNREFMAALRKAYRRPWSPPAPAFAIRLYGALGGPDPSLALDGYRIVPRRALEQGFEFHFPTLESALCDLVR